MNWLSVGTRIHVATKIVETLAKSYPDVNNSFLGLGGTWQLSLYSRALRTGGSHAHDKSHQMGTHYIVLAWVVRYLHQFRVFLAAGDRQADAMALDRADVFRRLRFLGTAVYSCCF